MLFVMYKNLVLGPKTLVSYCKMIFRSKLALYNLGIRPNYEKRILRKTAFLIEISEKTLTLLSRNITFWIT